MAYTMAVADLCEGGREDNFGGEGSYCVEGM